METKEIEYNEDLGLVTFEFDKKKYQIEIVNVTNVGVNRERK
jgi:hypothetical protein